MQVLQLLRFKAPGSCFPPLAHAFHSCQLAVPLVHCLKVAAPHCQPQMPPPSTRPAALTIPYTHFAASLTALLRPWLCGLGRGP